MTRDTPDKPIIIRPSWQAQRYLWSLSAMLLALPFFLLYPLIQNGQWGLVTGGGLIAVSALTGGYALFLWRRTYIVLDTERLIDHSQEGLFRARATTIPYSDIVNVSLRQRGIWQTLGRTGTVDIVFSTRGVMTLSVSDMARPAQLIDLIEQRRSGSRSAVSTAHELLARIRERVGEEKYRQLIAP